MEELKELLENVSDTYEDFVMGILADTKDDDKRAKITEYIKSNPDAKTDDIIECLDKLEGLIS